MKPHLLPMHYRLGRQLGIPPAEVKRFLWELQKRAAEGPQPAVVAGADPAPTLAIVALVSAAISTGLTIVAQFFAPSSTVRPARLKAVNREGRTISDVRRYAPRDGFDSLQDVPTIGETMPMVFANREVIDGVVYGGVRINTMALWSQLQTVNGQQLLRGIFLIGDGGVSEVDTNGFALGNNVINAYNFDAGTQIGSAYTLYLNKTGGRITSSSYIAGKSATNDPGNSQAQGGSDVYAVKSINQAWAGDFCAVAKPGANAVFGVHSPIGNNLALRVNPTFRPKYQAQLVPDGDDGDSRVKCQLDEVADAERRKFKAIFSTRSGIISGSGSTVGNTITYTLLKSSDALTDFAKALDSGNWSVNVNAQRISGSSTTSVSYESVSDTTSVVVDEAAPFDILTDHIRWLNSSDQVISQPIITVTPNPDPNIKKVTLSTRLKFDENYPTPLTVAQKDALLYTRFKIKFTNDNVDNEDEPSTYYRVKVKKKSDIQQTSSLSIDFQAETYSLSNSYGSQNAVYTINETKRTVEAVFNKGDSHSETAGDVASVVSGKQQQWDDAIQIGAIYKIGSAIAVCSSRSPDGGIFQSESDFDPVVTSNGQSITATFTVVKPGSIAVSSQSDLEVAANAETQPTRYVGTNYPHIFRIDIARFTTTRPVRLIEIGIRSNLGIRTAGLCNFKDTLTFPQVDAKACLSYKGDTVSAGSTLKQYNYVSGTTSTSQQRFSFHRIRVKRTGSGDSWIVFPDCYGFRGISQQNQYNLIRIQFPSESYWEIEFEPLSGWEIRSGTATGDLILVDDRLSKTASVITRTQSSVILSITGKIVTRSISTFRLPGVARTAAKGGGDLGLGYADGTQFVDQWGALAETFIYPEITSTAEGGPEHEIVFVNEYAQNTIAPTYPDMAICGLNILPLGTFRQQGQLSAYVNKGFPQTRLLLSSLALGPSHLLPDIALMYLTSETYGSGKSVSDDQIVFEDFTESAKWCYDNRYFFDGGFTDQQGAIEWVADIAKYFLLDFYEIDGRLTLKPVYPHKDSNYADWDEPVNIKGVFYLTQMRSFNFASQEEEARRPIQVSIKWREEREIDDVVNPGIFPVEREVLVRELGYSTEDSPITRITETSNFFTNEKHAIDVAKHMIRKRRTEGPGATIELTQDSLLAPLQPGDYIQIPMEMTYYDEFAAGIIRKDGVLISVTDLEPGTYNASVWSGLSSDEIRDQVITVFADGTASPTGIIFVIKLSTRELETFRIVDITPGETSGFTVQVIKTPTDSSGRLIATKDWGGTASDSNWLISR